MGIEVASVDIPVSLDLSGFNADLKALRKTKIDPIIVSVELDTDSVEKQRDKLEKLFSRGLDLKINVDDSALYDLNKHLDIKEDHVNRLQRSWDRRPLTVRVDTSEIDEALDRLEELEKKSKSKSSTSSKSTGGVSSSAGTNIESALEEGFSSAAGNIRKSVDIVTKPLQQATTGLFEGIGHTISERLTKGVIGDLEKKGALKLSAISEGISDFIQDSSGKVAKSFKKQAKEPAKSEAQIDLSNLSSLKGIAREAEKVAIELIPPEIPKQIVQQFSKSTREAGKTLANKMIDALEDDFSALAQALKQTKPDLGKAEAQFTRIREGFKGAYASLNKALADGNIELAESYQKTIQNMAKMARQEIDNIQVQLKAEGASGKFGGRLPTMAGSTKGHVTQYEKKATRKSIEIDKQKESFATESAQIGVDVTRGVAKGLASTKNVERQSSMIALSIINTLKDDLEIRSPSKKGIQIGIDFVRGIGVGIADTSKQVIFKGKELSANLQGSLKPQKIKPKSEAAIGEEKAIAVMDNFYDMFGKRFKETVFRGMPDDVANEMAGEVAGMIFSGFSMAFPQAIAAVGLGPMLVAALPLAITGLGLNKLLSPIINRAVEGIKVVEPIRQRFDVLGGSKEAGQAEFSYANKVAEQYSISKESSLGQYSQLAIAARGTKLEGEGVKELFEGIAASTRALRLSTADTNLVFMAYTQMLAKGKISMEELRQQLGERFPPAMGVFAKAMGVSVGEMGQLIESGNALSEDVLPKVGSILKQDFGKAAAGGGGGLLTAFTSIENAGFDLSVKLTEAFSGLFGSVVSLWSNILGLFNKNFDLILKLGSAFVIGVTAQIAVGLQQIMMMPGLNKAFGAVQGMFMSTFSKSMTLLAPFMFGIFVDIADDFLGAQNSIFDNMSKGVTNAVLTVITFIDDASRNLTGSAFFKPDHDNALAGFFIDIADKIKGVVQILPPGIVEMGALLIMFEQVSVLGKMFLLPTFQNFQNVLGGMAKGIKNAVTNGQNLKSMFRIMIADSAMAKGAMIALGVAIKAAFAFAVLAFAQGDFSDDLAKGFSKAETSIVNSIKSIATELDKLKDAGKTIGDKVGSVELKSKGVELNPLKIIGMSEDSFKWDDWSKMINKDVEAGRAGLTDAEKKVAQDFKARADNLGVGEAFTGQEKRITRAQQQVLNKAQDLQRMNKELETRLSKLNLTPSTVHNFVSGDIDKAVKEVQAIDQQLKTLGGKRSDLALINDTKSKASIKVIDKEIDALTKKRKNKAAPLTAALGDVDEIKKQLEDVGKAIDADEDLPPQIKKAYKNLLEPQKKLIDDTVSYLKNAGLYDAVKPLENIWQRVTEQLHDAELQFEKTKQASATAYKESQTQIYANSQDKGTLESNLEDAESNFLVQTQGQVSAILAKREAALKELLSISGVETNAQRKEEVDRLREEITKGKEELTGLNLEIAKNQSERRLRFQELTEKVDQYYKGVSDQATESAAQLTKQISEINNQEYANQINRAMLGVGDNIISQFVGSLLDAINQISQAADTDLDAQSQIAQAQKAFEDTVKSGEELRKQLPKIQASGSIGAIPVEIDLSTVANNKDVKALNSEINKGVSATEDLGKATENFNARVSESGDYLADNNQATQNLESSISNVTTSVNGTVQAADNLNTSVGSTTDSAQFLQNQIDANTTAADGTNTAVVGIGMSLDSTAQKTIANIEQTGVWHQWLGEKGIGGALTTVMASITAIGAGIMESIKKTVDWFKTFANNIPILNQVGQAISGFGQQIAQSPVGQAVGGAIQGAGNLINQGVGAIQGALGLTTDGKGKVTENYRTGTLAAQEYGAARPGRKHAGQDIDVSGNQQAQSFIGGVVTRVVIDTNGKGYGSYVDIFNKQLGVVERIAEVLKVNVKEGQTVQPGQAIGGGESRTGVFHYEIRKPADAQGRGGYGFEGSQDPIKFYEKLGIAKREGNQIKILKGLNAGQTLNAAEHRVGDGHNHFGEDDVKKANQKAAAGANSGTVGVGNNLLASMPQGNGQTPGQIVADLKAKAAIAQGVAPQQASGASGRFTMPLPTGGNLNSGAGQNVPSWIPKMSWQQHKQFIVTQAMQAGITDPNQIKYMLATAEHETGKGMYMREGGNEKYLNYLSGRRDLGNNGIRDAVSYRGAGYSQLTGKSNFAKWSPIVSKHFGVNIDLLKNPDLAAHPDIAAFILTHGMKTGNITGRAIGKYVDTGAGKVDFRNARRTINGIVPEQVAKIDKVLAGISLNEVQQMMAVAQKGGGGVPMQAVAQATGGQTGVNIQAPQAFVPSAPMTVWEPASLKGATPTATSAASVAASGNARIDQTQALAQQQRDQQQAAALRQAAAKTEGDTIQAINKSQQSLIQVQKQLRQAGFESRDIGEDITKMNLEAMGPLTLPQQREKAIQEQRRQYRDQGEKVNELIIDRENRKKAAQAILDLPGGIISPAARAKFDKILAMPISEDLKKRLQTELTSGSLGEELKKTLQQSVTQADQELVVLRKAQQDLNTGREVALKATEERFELEEKARANAAKFEQKGLDIATLQARLDNAKARADREGVTSSAAKEVVNLEALIGLQNQQLENEKQLEEIDKKVREKTLTEAEANTQKNAIKQRSEITQKTIQENQAYQEIVNARAVDARNREISLQAAKDELAVQKQQLETLKALPTTDPRRLEIPQLEYGIQLQELQLKLQEDIAAVQESVFKDPSSQAAGDVRIAKLKEEYNLNVANLGTRLKQQNVEQELAQQRAIIGIREQELGFTEQLLEAQTRSIELGRSSGDTLGDRYKLQADQQKLSFEKQILDVKELAAQSGKSAEEVAAIEAQLRKVNEIRLDNIQGEMDKAFKDRAIAVQQRTFDSTNSVLSAQQSLLSTTGQSFEASKIGKKIAINQQQMDFTNQTRELEEFIKTNAVASEQANVLRSNLAAVNDIKFQEIQAQFNPLKGVVDGVAGSLKGAFKSLIKDGKVDIKSFFDGILDSIADFLSNMLVEKLMGFLNPTKKKQAPGLLPDPSAQGQQQQPDYLSALGLGKNPLQSETVKKTTPNYLSALGLGENPLTATDGALSKLGSSQVTPMYVSVVNANQLGFAQGQNNIVPFNSPGMGGNLGAFGSMSSILGGKTDYISAVMGGGGFDPFSAFTATSPLPVNVAQAKPDLFSSLLGGGAGGGGGLGGILGSLGGMLGGGGGGMGGGFGGIIGSLLPMVGSLFGGIFAEGGVIGTGKSAKDDQLILAQRGEGILTHNGMRVIGGAAALNAINRTKGYKVPKFATGGIVGGEYGGKNSADAVQRGHEERERRRNEPIKLETTVINNTEYATVAQVEQAASKARAEGARQGAQYVQNKMENSVSWRNRHGIR